MENQKNNIVSLSGGKDSTAMLLMMLERGEPVHSAIFFDTGWEFPEMHDHVMDLTQYVWSRYGVKTWTLHPRLPFEYWMFYKPIVARKGPQKGEIHRLGNGWPSPSRRWCTARKVAQIEYYQKFIPNVISCVGYGADESHRIKDNSTIKKRYPLIEWGVTEADALQYCVDHGFHWGGLYDLFPRVSCFCCPLQRIGELRTLRKNFPNIWGKMLEWDKLQPPHCGGFKDCKSVHDFENRFSEEDRQGDLFPEMAEAENYI